MARITIEDCLDHVPNRFALVLMSAERTKQLMRGSQPLVSDHRDNKEIVTSLREIAAQRVQYQEKIIQEFDPAAEAEIRRAAQIRNYEGKEPKPETRVAAAEGDYEEELEEADLDDEFAEETDLDKLFSKLDSTRGDDDDDDDDREDVEEDEVDDDDSLDDDDSISDDLDDGLDTDEDFGDDLDDVDEEEGEEEDDDI